jgi:predicted metalloprotease with PDZ domain
VTYGGRPPSIRINVGRAAGEKDLRDDWTLTHEMVHLGFPNLTSDDHWAEEGLATYVEPLARARRGTLSEDKVWSDLMEGLPKGMPQRENRGLHGTKEWGRTYWGGALFWLLADMRIREQTRNRRGLPDALDGILDGGGDIRVRWDLQRTLAVADKAVGLTVLSNLYREMGTKPGAVDLNDLWRRLGIGRARGRVVYDNSAPLAEVRRAIVSAPRH